MSSERDLWWEQVFAEEKDGMVLALRAIFLWHLGDMIGIHGRTDRTDPGRREPPINLCYGLCNCPGTI